MIYKIHLKDFKAVILEKGSRSTLSKIFFIKEVENHFPYNLYIYFACLGVCLIVCLFACIQ